MTFIVSSVHTGSTHGIPGGAGVRRCVADNGGPHECPPQPFWTGVAMAPCFTSFPTRWTYSPHRFMQVPTNADFRSLSDSHVFGTVLHERTLKNSQVLAHRIPLYWFTAGSLAHWPCIWPQGSLCGCTVGGRSVPNYLTFYTLLFRSNRIKSPHDNNMYTLIKSKYIDA